MSYMHGLMMKEQVHGRRKRRSVELEPCIWHLVNALIMVFFCVHIIHVVEISLRFGLSCFSCPRKCERACHAHPAPCFGKTRSGMARGTIMFCRCLPLLSSSSVGAAIHL